MVCWTSTESLIIKNFIIHRRFTSKYSCDDKYVVITNLCFMLNFGMLRPYDEYNDPA